MMMDQSLQDVWSSLFCPKLDNFQSQKKTYLIKILIFKCNISIISCCISRSLSQQPTEAPSWLCAQRCLIKLQPWFLADEWGRRTVRKDNETWGEEGHGNTERQQTVPQQISISSVSLYISGPQTVYDFDQLNYTAHQSFIWKVAAGAANLLCLITPVLSPCSTYLVSGAP